MSGEVTVPVGSVSLVAMLEDARREHRLSRAGPDVVEGPVRELGSVPDGCGSGDVWCLDGPVVDGPVPAPLVAGWRSVSARSVGVDPAVLVGSWREWLVESGVDPGCGPASDEFELPLPYRVPWADVVMSDDVVPVGVPVGDDPLLAWLERQCAWSEFARSLVSQWRAGRPLSVKQRAAAERMMGQQGRSGGRRRR